jgi:hypothetical protein
MDGLARRLLELKLEAANSWIERIAAIDRQTIQEVVDRVPDGWASEICKQFTIDFLDASRDRLASIAQEQSQSYRRSRGVER